MIEDFESLTPSEFSTAKEIEAAAQAVEFIDAYVGGSLHNLGGIVGDTVRYWRFKNQVRIALKAKEYCQQRGIDSPADVKKSVAVPLIEEARNIEDEELADLFAQLLATSMDPRAQDDAHPAFIQIIQQLVPDEARLLSAIGNMPGPDFACLDIHVEAVLGATNLRGLRNLSIIGAFADIENPQSFRNYVDNLIRVRLLETTNDLEVQDDHQYEQIRQHFQVENWKESHGALRSRVVYTESKGVLRVTDFGEQFLRACVNPNLHW